MINIDSVFDHLKESTAMVIESMTGLKPAPGKIMPSDKPKQAIPIERQPDTT